MGTGRISEMDRRSRARNAIMFIALAAAVFVLSVGAVRVRMRRHLSRRASFWIRGRPRRPEH